MYISAIVITTLASTSTCIFTNKWVKRCDRQSPKIISSPIDCDELGVKGMKKSIDNCKHDRTLSVMIEKCPDLIKEDEYEMTAKQLFVENKPLAFRALLSNGRCNQLNTMVISEFLRNSVINENSPMISAVKNECELTEHQTKALKHAIEKSESKILKDLQDNKYEYDFDKHKSKKEKKKGVVHKVKKGIKKIGKGVGKLFSSKRAQIQKRREERRARGGAINIRFGSQEDGSETKGKKGNKDEKKTPVKAPMEHKTFAGNVALLSRGQINENTDILREINPTQATQLGTLTNGCISLTARHFFDASPIVVGNLPLKCFQAIPPEAFRGMSADQISKIKWWPFISREQIRYISPGPAIQAVNFDNLGNGIQQGKRDKTHVCWNLTKKQVKSIRSNKKSRAAYKRRCKKSDGPAIDGNSANSIATMGSSIFVVAAMTVGLITFCF